MGCVVGPQHCRAPLVPCSLWFAFAAEALVAL